MLTDVVGQIPIGDVIGSILAVFGKMSALQLLIFGAFTVIAMFGEKPGKKKSKYDQNYRERLLSLREKEFEARQSNQQKELWRLRGELKLLRSQKKRSYGHSSFNDEEFGEYKGFR